MLAEKILPRGVLFSRIAGYTQASDLPPATSVIEGRAGTLGMPPLGPLVTQSGHRITNKSSLAKNQRMSKINLRLIIHMP